MKRFFIIFFAISIILAFFLSPFASSSPDGLERVAEDKGFIHKAEEKVVLNSPIPDYSIPAVKNEILSTSLSGLIGTIITLSVSFGIGYIVIKRR